MTSRVAQALPDRAEGLRAALAQWAERYGLWFGLAEIGESPELWPAEARDIAYARPCRRAEFAAGRLALRRAMFSAGLPRQAIRRSSRGAPICPKGFFGTISHADGIAVGVLARSAQWAGVGVDLVGRPEAEDLSPQNAGELSKKECLFKSLKADIQSATSFTDLSFAPVPAPVDDAQDATEQNQHVNLMPSSNGSNCIPMRAILASWTAPRWHLSLALRTYSDGRRDDHDGQPQGPAK